MAVSFFSLILTLIGGGLIYFIFFKKGTKKQDKVYKDKPPTTNHFFRHCDQPSTEPISGTITGSLPTWLEGTLTRNGPGVMKIGNYDYNHLFDGLSILHRFHISNGKATYTSRILESDAYKRNVKAQRIVISEFGTAQYPDPCQTIFQNFQTQFSTLLSGSDDAMTDNCSVNVAYYGDQLYAMTETNFVRQVDPKNLKTVGPKTRITDYVAVNTATAHPQVLPDGTVYNVGTAYTGKNGSNYCFIKVPPSFNSQETSFKNTSLLAQIPFSSSRRPCYFHSFGLTNSDKAIFIESPLRLDILKLVTSGFTQKSFKSCMDWNPSLKTRFHVVSLKDGKVHPIVYEADPLFTFHHINAFEENDQIIVDISAYPRGDLVLSWESEKALKEVKGTENSPTAQRFVLPLNVPDDGNTTQNLVTVKGTTATAKIQTLREKNVPPRVFLTPEQLAKDWIELPRINYMRNGLNYNFIYGISSPNPITSTDLQPETLIKINIRTKQVKTWSEPGMSPSEPIFVVNSNSRAEDDGLVISVLLQKDLEAVSLLILDAKDFKEVSRINFKTKGTVTATFHGQWAQSGAKIHTY